ncbi:hypothetical protein ACN6LC_002306 [Streptomyces violaceoruber]|uniref:hypothetical protein n=1 Tax=Streptomyces TaxID=1883 RepID=UPI0004C916A5|nr:MULTISPECIES: hypothetical protein [Streptomyces]MDX3369577.1 hypothetical protein [Streptomyces sp. ME02-6987-2C]MDX3423611.1 hypothetical protein [Streptomyces sp. ME02-6985-2c]WTC49560.1 hypothetical protein OG855_18130 [Streptomyces anthocyanicus]GGL56692.1 hypothetical protein GCM10010095_47170 [Streptomyces anthocyanicus]GHA52596.1 hypothetical protein GCM10010391_42210 [Streptomyces anthocyanicus]
MRSTEEVVESLRQALVGAGVVLPSLCVDPVTGASDEPFALVDLGRCNVRVAERLASVVRGERPAVGTHAVDERDGRVGEVMGHVGGSVRLRPVAGGREWDCPRAAVAVARPEEVLKARLRRTNHESVRP